MGYESGFGDWLVMLSSFLARLNKFKHEDAFCIPLQRNAGLEFAACFGSR
jgi:hypothetical protein